MRLRIRSSSDVLSGALFAAIGLIPLVVARGYELGTAARMGPGYLPMLVGAILCGLGLVIALRGLVLEGEPLPPVRLTPMLVVLGSIAAFTVLVDSAGFAVASMVLVTVSALGTQDSRLREVAWLALGLTLGCILLFAYALGMPFKIWPV